MNKLYGRTVITRDEKRKAVFHEWAIIGEYDHLIGIIEYSDGSIDQQQDYNLKFLNTVFEDINGRDND